MCVLETMQDDVWFPSTQGPIDKPMFINEEALRLLSIDDGLVKRAGMTKQTKKRSQQIPHNGYGSCVSIHPQKKREINKLTLFYRVQH